MQCCGMEDELREALLAVCREYCRVTRRKPGGVFQTAIGNGRFYQSSLIEGSTFTVRIYDLAMRWFSDNWPNGVRWPKDVKRPPHRNTAA